MSCWQKENQGGTRCWIWVCTSCFRARVVKTISLYLFILQRVIQKAEVSTASWLLCHGRKLSSLSVVWPPRPSEPVLRFRAWQYYIGLKIEWGQTTRISPAGVQHKGIQGCTNCDSISICGLNISGRWCFDKRFDKPQGKYSHTYIMALWSWVLVSESHFH